jgi:hypothetical protein
MTGDPIRVALLAHLQAITEILERQQSGTITLEEANQRLIDLAADNTDLRDRVMRMVSQRPLQH